MIYKNCALKWNATCSSKTFASYQVRYTIFPLPKSYNTPLSGLQESTLFVQLLSPALARRPAGMSTPQMQYSAAQAIAGLPLLQWRDRKIDVTALTDPAQRTFLDAATVVATGIEDFKQYILQQLEAIEAGTP